MSSGCPSDNTAAVDQSSFWSSDGVDWDAHKIGWAVAGGCAVATVLISLVSVWSHCRHYTNRTEQRQIIRILYMPPIYAVISFFSYRYFRSYTYYSFAEVVYEAVTLSAFLLLLIEYVAATAASHRAEGAIARKDKQTLPIPFCCWRYRPTKAYFMYTIKWAVLQYVIVRPAVSIAGIVCQYYNVLCESEGYNFRYANVYLEIVDFISISVALYGLLLFYALTRSELVGRRPLAKFLCIKLIVMFTFYQSFVFSMLEGNVIKATQYWTQDNIADGLNALTTCVEMVIFAGLMLWAYPAKEYKTGKTTSISGVWRPLWDSINYTDFAIEIWSSVVYFIDALRGEPPKHRYSTATDLHGGQRKMDFGQAFGVSGTSYTKGMGQRNSSSEIVNAQGVPLGLQQQQQQMTRERRRPTRGEDENGAIAMKKYGGAVNDSSSDAAYDGIVTPPTDESAAMETGGAGYQQQQQQDHRYLTPSNRRRTHDSFLPSQQSGAYIVDDRGYDEAPPQNQKQQLGAYREAIQYRSGSVSAGSVGGSGTGHQPQ